MKKKRTRFHVFISLNDGPAVKKKRIRFLEFMATLISEKRAGCEKEAYTVP